MFIREKWLLSTMPQGNFRTRADWRSVEHLYKQFSTIVSVTGEVPTEITGALANSLGRILAFYEDEEALFIQDLLELWAGTDDLRGSAQDQFKSLYFDARLEAYSEYRVPHDVNKKRRPRPFETAVETCRRLMGVNRIRHALADIHTAAVLGGSVSYGRFYNVTGGAPRYGSKASDTDLLLVLKDYEQLWEIAKCLSSLRGVASDSLERFCRRAETFSTIRSQYPPCIFSHKLNLWTTETDPILAGSDTPGGYVLSFHIFSLADFDYLTLKDIPILEPPGGSDVLDRKLYDYRDTAPPNERAYDSRSFAGIPLGTHPLDPTEVTNGYVSNVQVCLIKEDRFCPGLHQNLILPQFELRWETEQVRLYLRMLAFRWKIAERLHIEKTKRPFEEQSLSISHVRCFVFSPHVTRRADASSFLATQQGRT